MPDRPIVLFDGVCNLCNGLVQFLIKHDPHKRLRFAPLQSAQGAELLEKHGVPDADSIVVLWNDAFYLRADAIILILWHLNLFWKLLAFFLMLFPPFLRDFIYKVVAARRYGWFGKRKQCMVPTEDIKDRFIT